MGVVGGLYIVLRYVVLIVGGNFIKFMIIYPHRIQLMSSSFTGDWFTHSHRFPLSFPTGYEGALPEVITELVGERESVLVSGIAGSGKTFLAKLVLERLKSKRNFEFVILLDIAKASKEGLDCDQRLANFLIREKHIQPKAKQGKSGFHIRQPG